MTSPNLAGLISALEWYAVQAEECRRIGSAGDPARVALDRDGGERARAALRAVSDEPGAGSVERVAKALFESDEDCDWDEWVAYSALHPIHNPALEDYRRRARAAVSAMLPAAPDPAIPADTQSREGEKP